MGTFFAEVQLASPARPDRRELVKLLVDSGSMYRCPEPCSVSLALNPPSVDAFSPSRGERPNAVRPRS